LKHPQRVNIRERRNPVRDPADTAGGLTAQAVTLTTQIISGIFEENKARDCQ